MTCLPFALLSPKVRRKSRAFAPHPYSALSLATSLQELAAERIARATNTSYTTNMPRASNATATNTKTTTSTPTTATTLLDLPDDVIRHIFRCLTRPLGTVVEGDVQGVQIASLRSALPPAYACKRLYSLLFGTLDNLCLWCPTLRDPEVNALSRRAGGALRRLVLRGCALLTDASTLALATHAPHLRAIDLSFCPAVSDVGIATLCVAAQTTLEKLLVRKCTLVSDGACFAAARCSNLSVVDLSYCTAVSDAGIKALVAGCGNSLTLLSISHCVALGDDALAAIANHCRALTQLCARAIPFITDAGFEHLCYGVGSTVEGIDVLDCTSLTRDPVVCALRNYCPRIADSLEQDTEWKTLEQVLVTTLRANIFIVHGCDPKSGRPTIHMVLVDNGDIVSANILSASTTDLSLLGVVLCKSYGNAFDDSTKRKLTRRYGILPSMLAE